MRSIATTFAKRYGGANESALALAEALLELGNATTRVKDLLLAGVERVALATYVGVDLARFGRTAGHELTAAGTGDVGVDVLGMDTGFH